MYRSNPYIVPSYSAYGSKESRLERLQGRSWGPWRERRIERLEAKIAEEAAQSGVPMSADDAYALAAEQVAAEEGFDTTSGSGGASIPGWVPWAGVGAIALVALGGTAWALKSPKHKLRSNGRKRRSRRGRRR